MISRDHPMFLALFLLVVAPIGAAVIVSALLLFGVKPHTVFAPGFAVKTWLEGLGLHVVNAVGVLTTLGLWWLVIVALGLAWDRRRAHT